MSDLKSCPFCGSAKIEFRDIAQQTLVAVCCGCNAEGGYNTIENASTSREQAVEFWNRRASPEIGERAELLERELKRCHEAIGAYVIAQAYADPLPDDAEDAADMTFGQHYWEAAGSHWAGEDLLSRAHEAAKARMRVENPVQVRDLDWSAAMGDVVASGGLPRDKDEDEDPVCTGCGGSGITYQTERPCACIPTALSAPSPSADALLPGEAMSRGALVRALGRAKAGQSDVLSCLLWAFENYGRLAPPKEGFTAYPDPELTTGEALLCLADAAAAFFGFETTNPAESGVPPTHTQGGET